MYLLFSTFLFISIILLFEKKKQIKLIFFSNKSAIEGIIMGERILNLYKTCKIVNSKNNLVAEIKFQYEVIKNITSFSKIILNLNSIKEVCN